ncbi:MAG: hypothetical protein Fues2KO_25570 [Fuerstiella sp.]
MLEQRCLLTNYVVTTTEDGSLVADGELSLREAIEAANTNLPSLDAAAGEAGPGTVDTITFDASLSGQTITLSGASLLITDDLIIFDSNGTPITINAGGSSRVFEIGDGANAVSISDVTVTGGSDTSGGGILVTNGESLTLTDVTVTGNAATGNVASEGGGGIHNDSGTLVITNSTISDNTALGVAGSGGGILTSGGSVTVSGSSISGNFANRAGGGIEDNSGAGLGLTLTNVALVDNVTGLPGSASPGNGGGLHVTGAGDVNVSGGLVSGNYAASEGGGLWNGTGTMNVTGNTLITANASAGSSADQGGGGIFNAGGTLTIDGVTIIGNNASAAAVFPLDGGQEVPAVTTSAEGDAFLQYNAASGTFDLRLFVTGLELNDDTSDPEVTAAHIHIGAAGTNGGVAVDLLANGTFVEFNGGLLLTLDDVAFPAANVADLAAGNAYINVHSSANAGGEIRGQITFPATLGSGGGILNDGGSLTVTNSVISSNEAGRAGGGIETNGGSVALTNVNLDLNTAGTPGFATPGNGGGLHTTGSGSVTISGGTVLSNLANSEGGGLWNSVSGTMTIDGSTLATNSAVTGGGIFNDSGDNTAPRQFTMDITPLNGSGVTGTGTVTVTQPTATTRAIRVQINATGMEDLSAFGGFHVAHIHGQFAGNRTRPLLEQGDGPFFDGEGGAANGFPPVNSILPSVAENDGVTIADGFLDFLEGRPEYGPVLLNLTSTQMRDAGTHNSNPPDGVPPLAHFLNLFGAGEIDPTMLFPSGTDFNLDTTYTFDLTNPDEARQFNNLAPLDLREVVIHGASIDKAISDAIDAAAMGTAPAGTGLGNGKAFRVTAPVAAAEIVAASGAVTISNATISGNTAVGNGGGLLNEAGAVTIVNSTISGNSSAANAAGQGGGGIFNSGTLEITDSVITDNTAVVELGNGGGIFNSASGTLTITSSAISDNSAGRAGGGIESAGTVELTDVDLSGNVADINGGGLHVSGPGRTVISGGTVTGNFAAGEGGGLWNGSGLMTISGGTLIQQNGAAGSGADQGGGGVFNAGGTIDIQTATISNNLASGGATFSLSGDQEVPPVTTSASGTATIQLNPDTDTFDFLMEIAGIAAADLTGAHIHLAAAGSNGPVIVNLLDFGTITEVNGTLRLELHDIAFPPQHEAALFADGAYVNVHTTANAPGEIRGQITFPSTMGSGGGIFNNGGTLTVTNGTISGNIAARAGGGIETNAGTVTLNGGVLQRNYAGVVGPASPGNGGGLHVTGNGAVSIDFTNVFQNFAAAEGGGLWNGSGTMNINFGTSIAQNGAFGTDADQGGGGVFNAGGTVNIDSAIIDQNTTIGATTVSLSGDQEVPAVTTTATGNANLIYRANGRFRINLFVGGIEVNDTTSLPEITGAHVHLGAAGENGPVIVNLTNFASFQQEANGIRLVGNDFFVPGEHLESFLSGNTYINVHSTANTGGEVRGRITFDTIGGSGGGILNDGGTVNIQDTPFLANVAGRAGGGIETNGGVVTMTGGRLQANTAGPAGAAVPGNGGGLHTTGAGNVSISNADVFQNVAANEGGGLWNSSTGTLTISNVDVERNVAIVGGGVYAQGGGSGTTTVQDSSLLEDNVAIGDAATQGGGGLYSDGANVLIDDSRVNENHATGAAGSGGGVFNNGGTLTVNQSTIFNNSASRAGGGLEANGGTSTLTRVSFIANSTGSAPGNGGAIHLTGAANVTLHNNIIRQNTAANEGGGLWNSGSGTLTVRNSTLLDNTADIAGNGGGVFTVTGGSTVLTNTLVASNDSGAGPLADDIGGANLSGSSSFNLIGNAATSGGLTDGVNNNIVGDGGTGTIDISTVVDSIGRPISGSPAIDAGTDLSGVGITTDLEGTARPQNGTYDIGAYEADAATASGVRFTIDDPGAVTEGDDVVFTVRINQSPGSTVTVDVATVDSTATAGQDYTPVFRTLTFQPGGTLSQTVVVSTNDDATAEDPERFFVSLTNAQGAIIEDRSAVAVVLDNDAGGRPVLDPIAQYPANNPPQLSWQGVAGAVSYEVWFARIAPNQQRLFIGQSMTTSTTYTPPEALAVGVYRYWVRGLDASDNPTPWSASPNTFEVRPQLIGPVTPTLDPRPTFTWQPIPGASGYEIFIRTGSGDLVVDDIQGTSFTPSQDLAKGPIRWWIRSADSIGNAGWSEVGLTDVRTTILSPTGSTSDTTPTITWQAVQNAGRYIVYLQNLNNNTVLREDFATGTSHTFSTPLASGNYRVWVKAIDAESDSFTSGLWSLPADFTVANVDDPSRADDALIVVTAMNQAESVPTDQKVSTAATAATVDETRDSESERVVPTTAFRIVPATAREHQSAAVKRAAGEDAEAIDNWMADPEAIAELLS